MVNSSSARENLGQGSDCAESVYLAISNVVGLGGDARTQERVGARAVALAEEGTLDVLGDAHRPIPFAAERSDEAAASAS